MSQYNLMEEVNRLPSVVVKDELTFTPTQKERVNLCLVERVTDANYSYILLIIVSDYARQIRCINHTAQAKRPPKEIFYPCARIDSAGQIIFEACTGRKYSIRVPG